MGQDRFGTWAILFGRNRQTADRFVFAAGLAFLGLLGLSQSLTGNQFDQLLSFQYRQGLIVLVGIGVSATHAYRNDGFITSIAISYILLLGLVLSGFVRTGFMDSGDSMTYVLAVLPLGFAVALGGLGFLIGVGGHRLERRVHGPSVGER
ncbi:hypothetical protein [Haladaptatus sp. CMSO5]|uniref:hypothetical protein n=1 Tax=Haladaptatus sp. CMSO5 TaxID=3120514 RepID=UPI002FCE0BFA